MNTDAACLLPQSAIPTVKIIFVVTKSRVHHEVYIYIYQRASLDNLPCQNWNQDRYQGLLQILKSRMFVKYRFQRDYIRACEMVSYQNLNNIESTFIREVSLIDKYIYVHIRWSLVTVITIRCCLLILNPVAPWYIHICACYRYTRLVTGDFGHQGHGPRVVDSTTLGERWKNADS